MHDQARRHEGGGGPDHGASAAFAPGRATLVEHEDPLADVHAKNGGHGGGHGGSAGGGSSKNRIEVSVGKTKNAELVDFVPVGTSESNAKKVIVLQLKPSDLPSLSPGDDLTTPCELELTTAADIGQGHYDPNAKVSIILGNGGDRHGTEIDHKQMTLRRTAHHTTVVFGREAVIHNLTSKQIPSKPHVNVVLSAWHPSAGHGREDRVIVGSNQNDYLNGGGIEQDQARLMAMREEGNVNAAHDNGKDGSTTITKNKQDEVIASHELDSADVGDQFYVEADVHASTNERARFSTQLVIANSPKSTKRSKIADPGAISQSNGENIMPGGSTTMRNVAVFKIGKRPKGRLFLNVVGTKGPAGATGSPTVKVKNTTFKIDRYDK